MEKVSHKIFVKKNRLYFVAGRVRAGDARRMTSDINEVLNKLQKPFGVIFDLRKAVQTHSMIVPEDLEDYSKAIQNITDAGRGMTVRIIDPDSFQNVQLNQEQEKQGYVVKYAKNMDEAEEIIEKWECNNELFIESD